jgi:hypothetical protein
METVGLTGREHNLIKTLRLLQPLEASAFEQTEEFVWGLVGKHLKWSWDDPASVEKAAQFIGLDPFLKKESDAITAEFECTLMDGLEEYPW